MLELAYCGWLVAEWLACWTQAQKALVQIAVAMLSGNSLRQTDHTHCASVHQAAKLVAARDAEPLKLHSGSTGSGTGSGSASLVAAHLRVAGVTARLAESNGSLLPGL